MDASLALQDALYARLKDDPALVESSAEPVNGVRPLVGVFDQVPPETPFPYITLGDDTSVADEDMDTDAAEHTVTIHTWSRYRGRHEAKAIMARVRALLHLRQLLVSGHTVWLARCEFSNTETDPDGLTIHGVQRFRFGICDAA